MKLSLILFNNFNAVTLTQHHTLHLQASDFKDNIGVILGYKFVVESAMKRDFAANFENAKYSYNFTYEHSEFIDDCKIAIQKNYDGTFIRALFLSKR